MWITKVSGLVTPVIVEIEAPGRLWFRSDGNLRAELTQSIGQVAAWREWFESEAHRSLFYQNYGISDWIRDYHQVDPVYCLIYGRRREWEGNPGLSRRRESLRPGWLKWMSFDRLRPLFDARNHVSARMVRGKLQAIAVPPTLQLGPAIILDLRDIDGLEVAIAANRLMSRERRDFLLERLPYWLDWANAEEKGSYNYGDSE
jgi:hypothetical protein